MDRELIIAIIAALVALAGAAITIWGQVRTARLSSNLQAIARDEERRFQAEKTGSRYKQPLATAASDLQSRLYNILELGFVNAYLVADDPRARQYAINNTAYVVAQYFAWTEIIRRDLQYVDLGEDTITREFARLQDNILSLFQTDRLPRVFRVFAGEQRAIGERMVRDTPRGPECIGYASFLDTIATDCDPLIQRLRQDIESLDDPLNDARPRLAAIQGALIDLLSFLDPAKVRFPLDEFRKARR